MKKIAIMLIGAALLMSSCGNYETTGAYTGAQFGHVLGSAIGGLSGGWRGHEIGSIVGTVGGTVAGAAIGHAADKAQQRKYEQRAAARQQTASRRRAASQGSYGQSSYDQGSYDQGSYSQGGYDQSGYDPQMQGDDRITFDGSEGTYPTTGYDAPATTATYYAGTPQPTLTISNAVISEGQADGVLRRGENCKVVFEIRNNSDHAVNDIFPLVEEATGNKHIHISPNLRVESIAPHQAIRYTAMLAADRGLRSGQIVVRVGVAQGDQVVKSQTRSFTINTAK